MANYVITIGRTYTFAASHRIQGHPKCGRMHGHDYVVWVKVASSALTQGMVLDFADLDRYIKPILDQMDHKYLLAQNQSTEGLKIEEIYPVPIATSTAELLAMYLFTQIDHLLPAGRELLEVQVWENPRSYATYSKSAAYNMNAPTY
jgi:6-pyruvoyltetrahydropterin/6-carboxytetrahydropterin synthase